MGEPVNTKRLSGWGRYPVQECHVYRPEKRRGIAAVLDNGTENSYIARGLGRSYGDQAINDGGGVVDTTRLDRMLDFDAETGSLHCEGGVSLADVIDVFLPRGYFLPTTPGTKFITVGGAIANDVHGKNHHKDGSFGDYVDSFELLAPNGELLRCSREENPEVFWATLGGCGLTGFILSARFRLQKVQSAYFLVDYVKTGNLHEVLAKIEETNDDYQYSVAWVDCLATGPHLGRSILMLGNNAEPDRLGKSDPFKVSHGMRPNVPFDMPQFLLNQRTGGWHNSLRYALLGRNARKLENYDHYFYPLDGIGSWNRLYGRRGFIQYQVTVPTDQRQGLVDILATINEAGWPVFLAVLKKLGPGNEGMLSFPSEGFTLTLDIPVKDGLLDLLHRLDQKTLEYNGRLYLAKDAAMTRETFEAMYPRVGEFKEVRHRLDPHNRLSSTQAKRLGLSEEPR